VVAKPEKIDSGQTEPSRLAPTKKINAVWSSGSAPVAHSNIIEKLSSPACHRPAATPARPDPLANMTAESATIRIEIFIIATLPELVIELRQHN
jgi:hypothetical protein